MQLSQEVVRLCIESEEEFPVSLDNAWKWIGYKAKRNARGTLVKNFEEGFDFLR